MQKNSNVYNFQPIYIFSNKKLFWKAFIEIFPMVQDSMKYDHLKKRAGVATVTNHF